MGDLGVTFYDLAQYVTWFFAYSFAGWVWEVIVSFYQHHRFVNRGFVMGPALPIYGVGALAALLLLSPIRGAGWQLVAGCAFAVVLEYGTSWAMEKLFHARWWDYTDKPLNINGRVYAPGIALFGVMMLAVVHVAQPVIASLTDRVPPDALELAALVLTAVFAADLASSILRMQAFATRLEVLQARLGELGDEARARTGEARAVLLDVVGDARDAMGDARDVIGEVVGDARDSLNGAADRARERVSEAAGAKRDALETRLRDLFAQLPRPSLLERRTLHNPYFKPTKNREAFEWFRDRLGNGRNGK